MNTSPKDVVQCIWDVRRDKTPEADIAVQLANLGLSSAQIARVLEMIEFSMNRAFMETLGGGHSADYDGDPFFKASLRLARRQFPASPGVRRERFIIHAAVGAAVAVGLFAIGAVIYYSIDLLRTPR